MFDPRIVIGGLLALAAIVVVVGLIREVRRNKALQKAATDLGMSFDAKPTQSLGLGFELMDRGRRGSWRNLIAGPIEDLEVSIFDYSYVTGSGKNSNTRRVSAVLLKMQSARVPCFALTRESLLHRVGAALGFQDIDFEEDPEFSKRFVLKGDDEHAIREIFADDLRRSLVEVDSRISIEAMGDSVLVYRDRQRIRPTEISARLAETFEIATSIWDHAATAGFAPTSAPRASR